jgi:hypothetical protein
MESKRKFFNFANQPNIIEIPLIDKLKNGELAIVLTWTSGALVNGKTVELQNLDLHVEF